MQIENRFQVQAPPDTVYAFLIDVNRVVTCMPGAELSEVVDPETFKGKVKIKVGPITVAYNGTARIVEKDEAQRRAVLEASGKETTGPGSAQAKATMTVADQNGASEVVLATDFTVAGRVANFGRGVMEDVSRRLVSQMADCIKTQLEAPAPAEVSAAEMPPAAEGTAPGAEVAPPAQAAAPAPAPAPRPAAPPPAPAKPVNAVSLFFAVIWDRIKRLFGSRG
jgi:carbon monoxide dehydrogenase subunit G